MASLHRQWILMHYIIAMLKDLTTFVNVLDGCLIAVPTTNVNVFGKGEAR